MKLATSLFILFCLVFLAFLASWRFVKKIIFTSHLGLLHQNKKTKILNPFGEFEEGFRLSEKALDYLMKWNTEAEIASSISQTTQQVIEILVNVPGMTTAHSRDFQRATPLFTLKDRTLVKVFINPAQVKHIFLADSNNQMIFGGYVGWIHNEKLNEAIDNIKKEFS